MIQAYGLGKIIGSAAYYTEVTEVVIDKRRTIEKRIKNKTIKPASKAAINSKSNPRIAESMARVNTQTIARNQR